MSGDIRVKTPNPDALNSVMSQLPVAKAFVVDDSYDGMVCTVRVSGDEKFVRFAITNQGYGQVVHDHGCSDECFASQEHMDAMNKDAWEQISESEKE